MQRTFVRIVWCTLLLFPSLLSLHAEDFWQDTLWIRKIPLGGHSYAKILFHPDGKSLFAASDQYLFRYDVQTGNIISTFEMKEKGYIRDYEISRDKQNLILITDIRNNGNIPCFEEWNIETGYVRHYRYDNIKSESQTSSLAMGKNDSLLYVGAEHVDGSVHVIDYKTGKFLETKTGAGRYIDISPDGRYMASAYLTAGAQGRTKLLELEKWQTLSYVTDIFEPKFSSDGRFFAGRKGMNDILLYDMENKREYLLQGLKGQYADVCFSSDSRYLFSIDMHEPENNGGYRVWSTTTKKIVYVAPWFFSNGQFIQFSPLENCIAIFTLGQISLIRAPQILANITDVSKIDLTPIHVNPNPASSFLNVHISIQSHENDLIVSDNTGKIVDTISHKLFDSFSNYTYSLLHLPPGLYSLRFTDQKNAYYCPFVINR